MNKKLIFSKEWLSADKKDFRILALLADHDGSYTGNLSQICDYLDITRQTSNRNKIKESIKLLAEKGFLVFTQQGQKYSLHLLPIDKQVQITIPQKWYIAIKDNNGFSESVAWEHVLKTYLWLDQNNDFFTNKEIAVSLNVSVDVVISAKKVLESDYNAFVKDIVREKFGDAWVTYGQTASLTAWWKET